MHGEDDVIAAARERWLASPEAEHDSEWHFMAWAVMTGHAILPNLPVATRGFRALLWQLRDIGDEQHQVHVIFTQPAQT